MNSSKGFSLLEVLITILIAILATVEVPSMVNNVKMPDQEIPGQIRGDLEMARSWVIRENDESSDN
jgi:prepilin-type N-terminal cleavage/methylation domain-containing protein